MSFEFVDQQGSTLGSPSLVSNRVLNLDFLQDSAVVQLNQKGVADGSLGGLVVVDAEAFVLDAVDLGPEGVYAGVRGSGVSASV